MKKLFVLGVILTLLAASASAQRGTDRVSHQRIERGFDNGQLTRPERVRLHRDQVRIKSERRRALGDGRLDRHERRKLHQMRRHERREMRRFKHNRRRRLI